MTMKYEETYIKQADNHIVAHAYEHIIANNISKALLKSNCLPLVDYLMSANSYDGIVIITIETYDSKVLKIYKDTLRSHELQTHDIDDAIIQISAEYERLPHFNAKLLAHDIQILHLAPWINRDAYQVSYPITGQARSLNSHLGHYGPLSKRSFVSYNISYTINDCPHELKPLAVYLVQLLGLSHIDLFYKNMTRCYDSGDEWALYQNIVGYLHTLRLPKTNTVSLKHVKEVHADQQKYIINNDVAKKLHHYIRHQTGLKPDYFSDASMFAYAYAAIGMDGWDSITQINTITDLIDMVKIEITEVI